VDAPHTFQRWRETTRLRSRRHNPAGKMSILEHIYELRYRLGVALLAAFAGAIIGFVWFGSSIGPVPSLGDLLTGPYCSLPAKFRVNLDGSGGCRLLQTQPFEAFMVRMKVGVATGAVLTSPIWLFQLWSFITPGLRAKEQRFTRIFVCCAVVLFAAGATLAYLIVPVALRTLVSLGGDQFIAALAGDDYVGFVLTLLVIFGFSFELPLLVVMLNRAGVLSYERLSRWRRGIIFLLFAFAGIVTPGSDPFSMLGLAGALAILFELAVQLARVHDRKRLRPDEDPDSNDTDWRENPEVDWRNKPADDEATGDEISRFNEQLRAMAAGRPARPVDEDATPAG